MSALRVGFIGTGLRGYNDEGEPRFGMNAQHARGYQRLDQCELAACADIKEENVSVFAESFGIPATYTDFREMLEGEDLDVVSISTWPHLHAEMTVECARAGVRAVHCEKPMAATWGDSKRMARVCREEGVQLTFNHQRRFSRVFRTAKELLDDGRIGELRKVEFASPNLYDWGTHHFDLCGYMVDQSPPEWVLAQVDCRTDRHIFGARVENQGIALWQYHSGVQGWCVTGEGRGVVGAFLRLVGDDGVIEVSPAGDEMPILRLRGEAEGPWEEFDCEGEGLHRPNLIERAVADVVHHLEAGTDCELRAENALQATEIIFAAYESVRRRGRADLPLEIEDHPLVEMVESGALNPQPAE